MLHRSRPKMEHGQSFVEMAISSVFLLIVILGMLDIARVFYIYIALQDSAEAAAIYLAQHPACQEPSGGTCADPNNAQYRARHASGAQINWTGVNILSQEYPATSTTQAIVKVKMSYNFTLLTPIIGEIVGSDSIVLTAYAAHVQMVD